MYQSNLSDQQWSEIEHFFRRSDPRGAKSIHSKQTIFALCLGSETSNFGDTINHGKIALDQAMANYEKATILSALKNYDGHKTKTAAALVISRATLFNKMKKYGIRTIIGT